MIFKNALSGLNGLLANTNTASSNFSGADFADSQVTAVLRVIIAIIIGIILAALWSLYDKRYLGSFVRRLLKEECTSPESAKTLYELGFDDKLGVRFSLRYGSNFSRWVVCVEREAYEAEMKKKREAHKAAHEGEKKPPKFKELPFKEDLDVMHYYVPEAKSFDAGIKFSAKGSNWLGIAIILVISIILLGVAIYALPNILAFWNNLFQ